MNDDYNNDEDVKPVAPSLASQLTQPKSSSSRTLLISVQVSLSLDQVDNEEIRG